MSSFRDSILYKFYNSDKVGMCIYFGIVVIFIGTSIVPLYPHFKGSRGGVVSVVWYEKALK